MSAITVTKSYSRLAGILALASFLGACDNDNPGASTDPSITIQSPAPNATGVALGRDNYKSIPIGFTLQNFMLSDNCGSNTTTCGQIYVFIDGTACNAVGLDYNHIALGGSMVTAKFVFCAESTRVGTHTVELSLRDSSHAPVTVGGAPVKASVTFTTVEEAKPILTLTAPTSMPAKNSDFNLTFATSNLLLREPTANPCPTGMVCGHVHVLIDDAMTCTQQSPAAPYNSTATSGTTATAKFTLCPTLVGAHDIILELHDDNHQPIVDAYMQTVSAKTRVTVQP